MAQIGPFNLSSCGGKTLLSGTPALSGHLLAQALHKTWMAESVEVLRVNTIKPGQ